LALAIGVVLCCQTVFAEEPTGQRFVRFAAGDAIAYGVVEGDRVRQIAGDLFGQWQPTDVTYPMAKVKLLVPTRPTNVLALAGNYRSHLGDQAAHAHPELFLKPLSCLIATGEKIVLPDGSDPVHAEAELVIVIGKRAKKVPVDQALAYVFGVTCGNDVSARQWQSNDVQWTRAKGSDTFGPCGPIIARGIDYDNLQLRLRVNGQVQQQQRTSDLVHGVAETVSWASRYMTLEPGDLIYTGTPGHTPTLHPGDQVEVEIEGIGTLSNHVVAETP
jgi:2-keto-4-pentenoate hydratase/2-oxohepta-3-ene-1,7-dioic acid hydratase in catechol pathway